MPQNALEWKILPSSQTSEVLEIITLSDPSVPPVRFALSVEKMTATGETVSSGMWIANCTYQKNGGNNINNNININNVNNDYFLFVDSLDSIQFIDPKKKRHCGNITCRLDGYNGTPETEQGPAYFMVALAL